MILLREEEEEMEAWSIAGSNIHRIQDRRQEIMDGGDCLRDHHTDLSLALPILGQENRFSIQPSHPPTTLYEQSERE
jgi:hypothetical protein